jgi:hypothetical protein
VDFSLWLALMILQADYIKMLMEHGIEAEALDYTTFLAALVGHAKAAYAAGLSLTRVCRCGLNFIALGMRWRATAVRAIYILCGGRGNGSRKWA